MFRFLQRLIKQLSVNHKPYLINAPNLVSVIFVSTILIMIFDGWFGTDVKGISVNYVEALVTGDPALMVALANSRDEMLMAVDALPKDMWQPALELNSEDAISEIHRVSSRKRVPDHALWLQGGLDEN